MTSKHKTKNQNKAPRKQQLTKSSKTKLKTPSQKTPSNKQMQRAKTNPNSLSANDVMQLQNTVGNQAVGQLLGGSVQRQTNINTPTPPPASAEQSIQRLVWRIGEDQTTIDNANRLSTVPPNHVDPTGSLHGVDQNQGGLPLAQLGQDETLHVVGHGDGALHIADLNPTEFVQHLVDNGLDPNTHKGTIRLVSCLSGLETAEGQYLTDAVTLALREQGFENPVMGFEGLVQVTPSNSIRIIPPDKGAQFDALSTLLNELHSREFNLAFNPPPLDDVQARQEWQAKINQLRQNQVRARNKVEALWEPMSLKHIRIAPAYVRSADQLGGPSDKLSEYRVKNGDISESQDDLIQKPRKPQLKRSNSSML